MANLKKLVKQLDIYGQNYNFKYKGNEKYKTACGGVVSLFVILSVISTTVTFILNYLDTTKPDISSSTRIEERAPKRDLYSSNYGFALGVYVNPSDLIPIQNITKFVTPMIFVLEMNTNDVSSSKLTFDIVEMIQFKPCIQLEDKTLSDIFLKTTDEEINKFVNEYLVCPDIKRPKEFYVEAKPYSPPFRIIQLYMFPCSLVNQSECEPIERLINTNLNFGFIDTSFTPSNKKTPLKTVPNMKDFRISISQETRWEITLKGNEVFDDNYDLFDQKKSFEFIDRDEEMMYGINRVVPLTHCTIEQISTWMCPPYSTLTIKSSGKSLKIVRKYPKILGTLGEIGGTGEIFIIIFGVFYFFYNDYNMKRFVEKRILGQNYKDLQKVYDIKNEKKEEEEFEKISKEIVSEREDIIRLHGNSTALEVLQNIIFKSYHKDLLPILLLNIHKLKLEKEKEEQNGFRRIQTQYKTKGINNLKLSYEKLMNHQPENELDKKIKEYFLENLPQTLAFEMVKVVNFDDINRNSTNVLIPKNNMEERNGSKRSIKFNKVVGMNSNTDNWKFNEAVDKSAPEEDKNNLKNKILKKRF